MSALPPFDYAAPASLDEALGLLAEAGGEALPLAGGQSLLPELAAGSVRARLLVDIGALSGLRELEAGSRELRIGALVSHAVLEHHGPHPLLREVAGRIGNVAVRSRGTIGGSLALALPGAEWCVTALALDGVVETASAGGRREAGVGELLGGQPLRPGELIVGIRLRVPIATGLAGHKDRVDGTPVLAVAAKVAGADGPELRLALGAAPAPPIVVSIPSRGRGTPTASARGALRDELRERSTQLSQGGLAADQLLVETLAERALERMAAP